jgi:hypothetical protein
MNNNETMLACKANYGISLTDTVPMKELVFIVLLSKEGPRVSHTTTL